MDMPIQQDNYFETTTSIMGSDSQLSSNSWSAAIRNLLPPFSPPDTSLIRAPFFSITLTTSSPMFGYGIINNVGSLLFFNIQSPTSNQFSHPKFESITNFYRVAHNTHMIFAGQTWVVPGWVRRLHWPCRIFCD